MVFRPRSPRVGRALSGDLDDSQVGLSPVASDTWRPAWPTEGTLPHPTADDLAHGAAGLASGAARLLAALRHALGRVEARATSEAIVFPIAVGVVSRIYASLLIALMPLIDPQAAIPRLTVFRNPFVQWDSQWYITIASWGYHAGPMQAGPLGGRHDFAFFPGWPILVSLFRPLGLEPEDVAAPLANVLFVVAAVVIFAALDRYFGRVGAKWGLVLLAFSPAAYVLSMGYSEPLYLLLIAGVFATRGPVRGLLSAAVGITRISGVALAAAAGVRWLRNWRDGTALVTAIGATSAFAAWWVYIWILTGDPLGWFQGSAQWATNLGPAAIWKSVSELNQPRLGALAFVGLILAASIALLRVNLELGLYALLAIGMSIVGAPVESMPRHALAAFPAFGLLAARLGKRRAILLALVFAAMEANFALLAFVGPMPISP